MILALTNQAEKLIVNLKRLLGKTFVALRRNFGDDIITDKPHVLILEAIFFFKSHNTMKLDET